MSKWIRFDEFHRDRRRKTRAWHVLARENKVILGDVYWFAPWRCYAFYPAPNTVFEQQCLRDIADFCEQQTREHRSAVCRKKLEKSKA